MEEKKQNRHLVREQAHQVRAFEYYYSLGESRSYDKVATEINVSPSTVKNWGRSFGWKQRLMERDLEVAREIAGRSLSDEINYKERNLKIVNLAMVKLARAIVAGDVKWSVGDLDKLVRLENFLRDGPDSRQEIVVADLKSKSVEELKEMVGEEVRLLASLQLGAGQVAGASPTRDGKHD